MTTLTDTEVEKVGLDCLSRPSRAPSSSIGGFDD